MKNIFAAILAVYPLSMSAVNFKVASQDGSITKIDIPNCARWQVDVGPKGNTLATPQDCTTTPVVSVPAICENAGHPLQVLIGTLDWNVGGGIAVYSQSMRAGNAYVYTFKTGEFSSNASLSIAEYAGAAPERTLIISETPCDFDPLKVGNAWGFGTTATAYFSVGQASPYNYAQLKANTTYYVNIKNATYDNPYSDTCLAGQECRFVMSLRR